MYSRDQSKSFLPLLVVSTLLVFWVDVRVENVREVPGGLLLVSTLLLTNLVKQSHFCARFQNFFLNKRKCLRYFKSKGNSFLFLMKIK